MNGRGENTKYEVGMSSNNKPEKCYEDCKRIASLRGKNCTGFDLRNKCVSYLDELITSSDVLHAESLGCYVITQRSGIS